MADTAGPPVTMARSGASVGGRSATSLDAMPQNSQQKFRIKSADLTNKMLPGDLIDNIELAFFSYLERRPVPCCGWLLWPTPQSSGTL